MGPVYPVTLNTPMTAYLDFCLERIRLEREREVAILDLDGTLYDLDGADGGYQGSRLENSVVEKAIEFIQRREMCSYSAANDILQQGLMDPTGLSQFLSNRYSINRDEYFRETWDINPRDYFSVERELVQRIREIQLENPDIKMILLTSSPSIWARRVIDYLGLGACFEMVITGEEFTSKIEIFNMIAQRYRPGNVVSIGDQVETDIMPAENLGMRGVEVKGPLETITVLDSIIA